MRLQARLLQYSREWGILRNECKRSRWGQNAVMLQSRTPGCKWSKAQSGQAGPAYLSKPLKVLCSLRNLFKIQYSKVAAFTMHKNLPKGSFVSLLWYLWFNTFEWNSWQICILGIPCIHESPCEYALRELRKEGKTFVLSTPLFIPCGTPRKLWVLCCYTVECRTNTSSFPKYGA